MMASQPLFARHPVLRASDHGDPAVAEFEQEVRRLRGAGRVRGRHHGQALSRLDPRVRPGRPESRGVMIRPAGAVSPAAREPGPARFGSTMIIREAMMPGILAGLRIVEGSAFVAAPLCGLTLAQLGADVIRFDQIGGGPDYPRWPLAADGQSLLWAGMNKDKRSIQLDLRSPGGRRIVRELIAAPGAGAGIFLTSFPARGWLAYESLREARPDLIMVTITGNADGSSEIDYTVNAATGYPAVTGPRGLGQPVNSVFPAWDALTGMTAAVAILAAERHRRLTGDGQLVELALSDVALAMTGHLGRIAHAQLGQDEPAQDGNHIYGAFGHDFRTRDGRRVMVTGLTARQWQALVAATGTQDAMGKVEEATGEDLATQTGRFRARDHIEAALRPWFAARDLATVRELLGEAGACWGPYQTFRQLTDEDPRCSAANPMFAMGHHPGAGDYLMPATPLRFSGVERPAVPRVTLPGQHTTQILAGLLGYSHDEAGDLYAGGIVAGRPPDT
jgi:2-methylfumaryl-CoA isomerase